MLHDETRKLLIEAWNKTHNAKEIAECFSVNTSTVYRLEKQMRETGSVKTMTSQRGIFNRYLEGVKILVSMESKSF